MIIRSFDESESGGFDPRNYAQIGVESITASAPTNLTILNISGAGFIDLATVASGTSSIEIIIDGISRTYAGTNNYACGFCGNFNYITADSSTLLTQIKCGRIGNYQCTTCATWSEYLSTSSVLASNTPLFFESSLVIKITGSGTNTSYSIRGGLLV